MMRIDTPSEKRRDPFANMCGQRPVFIHLPTRYVGYYCGTPGSIDNGSSKR